MTVFVNAEEAEILGGDTDEGWVAFRFSDEDEARSTHLQAVKAEDPEADIYDPLRDGETFRGVDFSQYLPLRLTYPRQRVSINARPNRVLYDVDLAPHNFEDMHEYGEAVTATIAEIGMAWTSPKRFVFEHRDSLPDGWEDGE